MRYRVEKKGLWWVIDSFTNLPHPDKDVTVCGLSSGRSWYPGLDFDRQEFAEDCAKAMEKLWIESEKRKFKREFLKHVAD